MDFTPVLSFDPALLARLAVERGSKKSPPRITSRLPAQEEQAAQAFIKRKYLDLLPTLDLGVSLLDPASLQLSSYQTYWQQLRLLAALQLDYKPLLARDWLVGALGTDAPLLFTLLNAQGRGTATSLNANELVTLADLGQKLGLDLSGQLDQALPSWQQIPRGLEVDVKSPVWSRIKQSFEIKRTGQDWQTISPQPQVVDILDWAGKFSFLPLELKDTGSLATYLATYRKGERFSGLVLKENRWVFRDSVPGEKEHRAAYAAWLSSVLSNLCQEKLVVLVNTTDAPYALPILLRHNFQLAVPSIDYVLPFTPTDEHTHSTKPIEIQMGAWAIRGGNLSHQEPDLFSVQTIYLDLDGCFLVLEGNAGQKLVDSGRQLTAAEDELVTVCQEMQQQKSRLWDILENDREFRKRQVDLSWMLKGK